MELVSGKVVPGCSNAGNPFHECTIICIEKLNSGDVHKKEKKLFGFGKRTPSRETPPGSPARGSRSPLAGYFGKKKVESGNSTPTTDHSNGNFLSRLSPLQQLKNEPANNVDSLPASPSLALYSGGDFFARRTNQYGGEDDDDLSPKPFGPHPKTPEHPLRTPKSRPRTPERHSDARPWDHQEDPILVENRPRTPERPSYTPNTRPRTPIHESAATGRRPQTPEHRPRTPERPSYTSDTRPRTPVHESAATGRRPQTPETRSRTPIHESAATGRRPQTPETRYRTPIHESAATGRRPQTPETRSRTPEYRSVASETRPRTPIHESAATGRRPQTPEHRPRTANHRGRSPEFMARDPGPRSKTPEPQPTFIEPLPRTPKLRSKTPEPSPRIPQVLPISHRSLDSAALQTPRTVETMPRMPEHQRRTVEKRPGIHDESRPKTSVYRGRSPNHREMISQTQQAQAYNYLGSKAESVYIEKDDESVLLFPETLLSPQERSPSRPITPNRRGYETPSKQEEHFDQLDDSASTDDDKFSFVDEHEDKSIWLYPETTSKSGSSTREQEEQHKANNEHPELSDESQSFSGSEISRMKGIITIRDEMQSIVSESYVSVGDYKVRKSVSATLEQILHKHGDIASSSKLQSLNMRSYYLEMLASVVLELQTTPLEHLKESRVMELVAIVKDVESVKIKSDWLKPVLEDIVDAVKHYDEHKISIIQKQVWEGDMLLVRQEMEKQIKELKEREKKVKEWRERLTEMAGKLGDLDMRRERLQTNFTFLSSKVDKFQGKTLLQGIL